MAGNTNRYSSYTTASVGSGSDGKNGEKAEKKDLWSSMLDGVASAKRLPEKNIILLGGTVDSQREFFESLSNNELRRTLDRNASRMPPVANSFALGYTYYDVLDADQEDTLARISLYTLTNPSPSFASLLKPLLTPQTIPNTLIVILLDWSQPWKWMRQLREWILLLRTVLISLSHECMATMEEVMLSWRDRGRGGGTNLDGTTALPVADDGVALPPGPGEWEDALGIPLCVVAQNVTSHGIASFFAVANLSLGRPKKWNTLKKHKVGRRRSLMLCYSSCGQYCLGVCCPYFSEKTIVTMLMWFRRWRFSDLHHPLFTLATPKLDSLKPWHPLTSEEATTKAQCHRQGQDCSPSQLGLVG